MPHALQRAVCAAMASLTGASFAVAAPLPSNRNIDIEVANDGGALYGTGIDDTYRIYAPGGGLNQLHISTDPTNAGVFGQVTTRNITTSSTSGTFWVTTTGGRGYNDDIILMFSMKGPIADNFSLRIKSSGYQWTASSSGVVDPVYANGAVDEIFTKDDLAYGPQTAKPGPGEGWILPFYSGQDINDPSTAEYLMFVDLYVGNHSDRSSTDSGNAKVEFDLSGIYQTTAAFNAYAWAYSANIADATINWTNRLSTNPSDAGQSGYSINTTAVPEPGTLLLLAAGLGALSVAGLRRRTQKDGGAIG
ncbi:MAG: PEP-CTERM sorting domain-containing protein [Acetobacteraceae bacterium]